MSAELPRRVLCSRVSECGRGSERARRAAELSDGVRYLRTTFLPGDETILHHFEAPSAAALEEAGRRVALAYERIVEAVDGSAVETKEEEK